MRKDAIAVDTTPSAIDIDILFPDKSTRTPSDSTNLSPEIIKLQTTIFSGMHREDLFPHKNIRSPSDSANSSPEIIQLLLTQCLIICEKPIDQLNRLLGFMDQLIIALNLILFPNLIRYHRMKLLIEKLFSSAHSLSSTLNDFTMEYKIFSPSDINYPIVSQPHEECHITKKCKLEPQIDSDENKVRDTKNPKLLASKDISENIRPPSLHYFVAIQNKDEQFMIVENIIKYGITDCQFTLSSTDPNTKPIDNILNLYSENSRKNDKNHLGNILIKNIDIAAHRAALESNMSLYKEHKRVLENNKEVSSPAFLTVSLTGKNIYYSDSLPRVEFSENFQETGSVPLAVPDIPSPSRLIPKENHIEGQHIKREKICSGKNDSNRILEKNLSAEEQQEESKGFSHKQIESRDRTENSKEIPEIHQRNYKSKSSEDKRLEELNQKSYTDHFRGKTDFKSPEELHHHPTAKKSHFGTTPLPESEHSMPQRILQNGKYDKISDCISENVAKANKIRNPHKHRPTEAKFQSKDKIIKLEKMLDYNQPTHEGIKKLFENQWEIESLSLQSSEQSYTSRRIEKFGRKQEALFVSEVQDRQAIRIS